MGGAAVHASAAAVVMIERFCAGESDCEILDKCTALRRPQHPGDADFPARLPCYLDRSPMTRTSVSPPAISLEVLPADYGDSLLVSCPVGDRVWRLLMDTGPDECWPRLRERLSTIPPGHDGKRHIDLVVISHIDHDHIGGASLLFKDRSLGLSFGDVWFNAPPTPASRGVAEGQSLATILGGGDSHLPWNQAFKGKAAVVPIDPGFLEVPAQDGQPRITLLSPSPSNLKDLFKVWDQELMKLSRKEHNDLQLGTKGSEVPQALNPKVLAAKITAVDRSVPNGSSIAFLLEHGGASVLLGADAFPTVLIPSLHALALHRKHPLPLKVDAFKLNHHGSRANVTVDLLKAVQADHYIVSTNGAIFNHPDDEAISRVVVHGGDKPTLWFNFDNERNRRWSSTALEQEYGYRVEFPAKERSGVQLELGVIPRS